MWIEVQLSPEQTHQVQVSASAVLKTIISVVGGAGSVIALAKTSMDLLQKQSVLSRRNSELERAGRYMDLIGKFPSEKMSKEHQEAFSDAAENCLRRCLDNLRKLNLRLEEIRQDPNFALRPVNKLLLIFRPAGVYGWILHVLTYATIFTCGWYALYYRVANGSMEAFWTRWRTAGPYLGLTSLLVLAAVFRGWALEERRRSFKYRKPAGPLARWLVMRFPESVRMLVAQIMFFVTSMSFLTLVYASLSGNSSPDKVIWIIVLTALSFLLMASLIFRGWAIAELVYQEQKPQLVKWRAALFSDFFKDLRAYGLLRAAFLALLPLLLFMVAFAVLMSYMFFYADGITYGLLSLLLIPLPNLTLSYALFRLLRIRRSLAAKNNVPPEAASLAVAVST